MHDELGRRMYGQRIAIRGLLDVDGWRAFLLDCIKSVGMTPSGEAAVWSYPDADGKGGQGTTICQPMVESYIVIDVWDSFDGAYLDIASCRRFNVADLVAPMQRYGLGMHSAGAQEALSL